MKSTPPENTREKWLTYPATHPYETLFARTPQTRNVWVVFHGIGFLSRYFLRYFTHLDPKENYVIAPQAPSLYYLDAEYRNVGASWLTREHTREHMANLLNYLDALSLGESLDTAPNLILMGYSQGVSVLCRWVALKKVRCSRLVLYAGKVPRELTPADFSHLGRETRVEAFAGRSDPFLENNRAGEYDRLETLFPGNLVLTEYEGGHELLRDYIRV
jgi:predicted esterase